MGRHSLGFYFLIAAGFIVLMTSYSMLSPILLAFLLTVFITLAVNPLVLRLRELAGGRRLAA
jgi:predicted PurR-regulated permease PerM